MESFDQTMVEFAVVDGTHDRPCLAYSSGVLSGYWRTSGEPDLVKGRGEVVKKATDGHSMRSADRMRVELPTPALIGTGLQRKVVSIFSY